jgi:large repetitive protein
VTMQFSSPTYREDESQTAIITVTRSVARPEGDGPGVTSTVNYATVAGGTAVGGTACTTGVDYISTSGTLTFNPGETSKTFTVTTCSDGLVEADETVNLALSNPTGGVLGNPSNAVLTISETANLFRNTTCMDLTLGGVASQYPSQITVTGGPIQIPSVRVTLFDVWHQFPDNIDVLLVGPQGQKYIPMADAGGPISIPQNAPVTLTFVDSAVNPVPNNGPLVTGNFKPVSWEAPQSSFPAGAPPAPYIEPNSSGVPTLNSTFGFTNANGVWSLYIRDDAGTFDPNVVVGQVCGWGIDFPSTTAAGVSLSGRVTTAGGNGVRNARVTISGNSLPEARTVTTGSFGYFSFEGLTAGETYVVTVNSQRYTFLVPSRVVTLVDNLTDFDFVAEPNESR